MREMNLKWFGLINLNKKISIFKLLFKGKIHNTYDKAELSEANPFRKINFQTSKISFKERKYNKIS